MEVEIKYNSPLQYLDYDVSRYIYENYIFSKRNRIKYNRIIRQLQMSIQKYRLNERIENNNYNYRTPIYINFLSLLKNINYKKCCYCDFKSYQMSHLYAHLQCQHGILFY